MKTLVIAPCESCPSRRRRCCIIPSMVLKTVRHLARYEREQYYVRSTYTMHIIIVLYDRAVVQRTSIYRTFIYMYVPVRAYW